MYAKEGFIRKSCAMYELSSNNPDLARQVFCILLGCGTWSCQAGGLPHGSWCSLLETEQEDLTSRPINKTPFTLCVFIVQMVQWVIQREIPSPCGWEVDHGLFYCTLTFSATEGPSHAGSACKGGTSQACTLSWLDCRNLPLRATPPPLSLPWQMHLQTAVLA